MQGIRDYIASQGPRVTMCAGGHGRLVPSDVAPIHRRRVADADRCPARGLCAHARRAEARLAVIRNRRADSDPWPAPPPAGRRQQGRPPNVLIRVSLPGASLEVVAKPVAAIGTQACRRGGGGGGRAADCCGAVDGNGGCVGVGGIIDGGAVAGGAVAGDGRGGGSSSSSAAGRGGRAGAVAGASLVNTVASLSRCGKDGLRKPSTSQWQTVLRPIVRQDCAAHVAEAR